MIFFHAYLFHFFPTFQMEGCQVLRTSSGILSLAHCNFFKTDVREREHGAKISAAAKESEATDLPLFEPTVNTASCGIGSAAKHTVVFGNYLPTKWRL